MSKHEKVNHKTNYKMQETAQTTGLTAKVNVESIKSQMQELAKQWGDYKKQVEQFNENAKFQEALDTVKYEGYVNPNLSTMFFELRKCASFSTLGESKEEYFALKQLRSLEGLSLRSMASVLNFFETVSEAQADQYFGHIEGGFDSFLKDVYDNMAINGWNKQVDGIKETISQEKMAIVDKMNAVNDELNKLDNLLKQKTKKKSRAERKKDAEKLVKEITPNKS